MIYDNDGNLTNKAAFQAAKKISSITRSLYASLLRKRMPIVEGWALMGFLKAQIDVDATMALMMAQCKLKGGKRKVKS